MALILKGSEPKGLDLEDGAYEGKIKFGEVREATDGKKVFYYYDLYIELKDKKGEDVELKRGYSVGSDKSVIVTTGALGGLIERFTGKGVKLDEKYNLEEIFDGKTCKFLVMKNKKGFFEIARDSVKPLNSQGTGEPSTKSKTGNN